MKKIWLFLMILILSIIYIVVINYSAEIVYNNSRILSYNINNDGGMVNVGVSEKVDVIVRKERWYGIIIERISDNRNLNILYLFDFIKIPINVNSVNWVGYHLVVLLSFIIFVIVFNKLYKL